MRLAVNILTPEVKRTAGLLAVQGSLDETLPRLRDYGFDAVEFITTDPSSLDVDEISRTLDRYGFSMIGVNTGRVKGELGLSLTAIDDFSRIRAIMRTKEIIDFASIWGAPVNIGILRGKELPEIVAKRLGTTNGQIIDTLVSDIIKGASEEEGIGFSEPVFEAVEAFSAFNYEFIYRSDILNGYTRYFTRLLNLIADYLEDLYSSYGLDEKGYMSEHNMLAAGFYSHISEMYPKYMARENSDARMIIDYIAGMTDNFTLDCANEILKPDHLNDEIDQSITGKWFDARL